MIKIIVNNSNIEISGHSSNICSTISILSQFICSIFDKENLIIAYHSTYGRLECTFEETELTKKLLLYFVDFIKSMNYTGIYLINNLTK